MAKMRGSDYGMLVFRSVRRQRLRSSLAISAVLIGAASITVMLSLVSGAKKFYLNQFEETGQLQQVVVTPQKGLSYEQALVGSNCDNCPKLTNETVTDIKSIPDVTGVSPVVNVNVFEGITLDSNTQVVSGAQAYQPDGVVQHSFVAGGNFSQSDSSGKIIIGRDYADQWGYKGKYDSLIGKEVTLTTSSSFTGQGATLPDPAAQFKKCQTGCKADDIINEMKPTTLTATIVGVETDAPNSVFVPMTWANLLLQSRRYEISPAAQDAYTKVYTTWNTRGRVGAEPMPQFTEVVESLVDRNGYSLLIVEANNKKNVDTIASKIQSTGFGAVTAQAYVQNQMEVFDIISLILGSMGGIALFVAAIGVINVMVMATFERTREIGVMRAVGARRATVSRLFTMESSLLGFIGGTLGVVVGYLFIQLANVFINTQLAANGLQIRGIIGLPIWLIFAVIFAATIIGMLAGLYPARRAARLNPVEALRHD